MPPTAPPALPDVVAGIVAALGEGWAIAATYHAEVRITGPRGECVRIRRDTSSATDRLTMNGILPADLTPHSHRADGNDGIGVNGARTAAAVAADIRRRLLPGYAAAVAAARLRQVADLAEARVRDDLAARVAAALGPQATMTRPDHGRLVWVRVGTYGAAAHARMSVPHGDGTVALTLDIRQDLAQAVAAALAPVLAEVRPDDGRD